MTSEGRTPAHRVDCVRVYTDDNNVTRFEDITIDLDLAVFAPPAPPLAVSPPVPASAVMFAHFPAGWQDAAHPAPARQFVMVLFGEFDGTVGEETRRMRPGDIALMEDTAGPGHGMVAVTDVLLAIVRL